jgi:FAD synthase
MNMAIRGMDFDFGKEPANTFALRANIDETEFAAIITEQGGRENHRERNQDCGSFSSQFG